MFIGTSTMRPNSIMNVITIIAFYAIATCLLTAFINRFFIARRFDPVFKAKLLKDVAAEIQFYNGPIISGATCLASKSFRGSLYAFNMVFKKYSKNNWLYGELFEGYDFFHHAKLIDIVLSYVYGIAFIILFIAMIAFSVVGFSSWVYAHI